jgi:hypothetical protein
MTNATWMPLYWEPVAGTDERIMAGVIVDYENSMTAHRILRDDVLEAMYGKASGSPKNLIDTGLRFALKMAEISGLDSVKDAVLGLHPGNIRTTEAKDRSEAVRIAALMFSSLSNLDLIDDIDADDAPTQEETNRRLSTAVRQIVVAERPDLDKYFNRNAKLVDRGEIVKIGFLSERSAIHYGVLHPMRQPSSVKDARAKIFELFKVHEYVGLPQSTLILAVPRQDEPSLGNKQLLNIIRNTEELVREAQSVGVDVRQVNTAEEAARETMEIA